MLIQQGVTAIFEKSYYVNFTNDCFLILNPVIPAQAGINLDFSPPLTKGGRGDLIIPMRNHLHEQGRRGIILVGRINYKDELAMSENIITTEMESLNNPLEVGECGQSLYCLAPSPTPSLI